MATHLVDGLAGYNTKSTVTLEIRRAQALWLL